MTEKQINKILDDFRDTLEDLVPERKDQITSLWLSLKEMFDQLMLRDLTKGQEDSLSRRNGLEENFDNIIAICKTSIKLIKKNDLDSLGYAFGDMGATLFQIHLDAVNARKRLNSIMNKVSDLLPDDEED